MFSRFVHSRVLIVILSLSLAGVACNLGAAEPTLIPTAAVITPTLFVAVASTNTPQISTSAPISTTAPVNTNVPVVCTPRTGWLAYRVQAGDTVSRLAARTGTTTDTLVSANCLTNANQIAVGQIIYLPRIPNTPTATITRAPVVSLSDYVTISPSQGQSTTERTVQPGDQVTLSVNVQNAATLSFFVTEQGRSMTQIGTLQNPANPATFQWQVPNNPGVELFISAQAKGSDGVTSASTVLVKIIIGGSVISVPGIGKLSVSPSEGPSELDRTVKVNMQVTLLADNVSNAKTVTFYMQDKANTVTVLGISQNPTTSAQLLWQTPDQAGTEVYVYAVAQNTIGTSPKTTPVLIRLAK